MLVTCNLLCLLRHHPRASTTLMTLTTMMSISQPTMAAIRSKKVEGVVAEVAVVCAAELEPVAVEGVTS